MFRNNFPFFRIDLKVDHSFCELIGDLYISYRIPYQPVLRDLFTELKNIVKYIKTLRIIIIYTIFFPVISFEIQVCTNIHNVAY